MDDRRRVTEGMKRDETEGEKRGGLNEDLIEEASGWGKISYWERVVEVTNCR